MQNLERATFWATSCVFVSSELSGSRVFARWLIGHPVQLLIRWFIYIRSTASTSYVDTVWSPRRPPCSTSLVAAFLLRFWPRTSQTAAGAMTLLRPAAFPLPRQRLLPSPAVQRRHDLLLRRALHIVVIVIILFVRRFTWAFRDGTV